MSLFQFTDGSLPAVPYRLAGKQKADGRSQDSADVRARSCTHVLHSPFCFLPSAFCILYSVFYILLSTGCSYSFKGGTVPPHLRTVAIPAVDDVSGYGDPSLRDLLTRELTQKFITDATLELADRNTADAVIEGTIVEVQDAPNVLQGGENVAQRRITVRLRAVFNDLKLRKKVWEKEFTQWGDYPSGGGLTQRQEGLQEAVRKITEDILNETVAGW